jgi:hypothetical protein
MLLHRVQQFGANGIAGLGPAAWFRYGTGITITGSGVSQWNDQSGNGRHLLQATDANRPQKQADSSILFDGVAYFLKCNAFTLPQPVSLYLLMKQVTWTAGTGICDGNAVSTGLLINRTASPQFALNAEVSVRHVPLTTRRQPPATPAALLGGDEHPGRADATQKLGIKETHRPRTHEEEAKEEAPCVPDPGDAPRYPYGTSLYLRAEDARVGTEFPIQGVVKVIGTSERETQGGKRKTLDLQITKMGLGIEEPDNSAMGRAAQKLYGKCKWRPPSPSRTSRSTPSARGRPSASFTEASKEARVISRQYDQALDDVLAPRTGISRASSWRSPCSATAALATPCPRRGSTSTPTPPTAWARATSSPRSATTQARSRAAWRRLSA